jgi:hypothetical protein
LKLFDKMQGYRTLIVMSVPALAPTLLYLLSLIQNVNFQTTLISVLALFGITADPAVVGAWVITIVGILGVLLRLLTTTPVAQKK